MSPAWKDYMKSPEWLARRKRVLLRCFGVCEHCRAANATRAHHVDYPEKPELDRDSNCRGLCDPCHALQVNGAHLAARTAIPRVPLKTVLSGRHASHKFFFHDGGYYGTLNYLLFLILKEDERLSDHIKQQLRGALDTRAQAHLRALHIIATLPQYEQFTVYILTEDDKGHDVVLWNWYSFNKALDDIMQALVAEGASLGVRGRKTLAALIRVNNKVSRDLGLKVRTEYEQAETDVEVGLEKDIAVALMKRIGASVDDEMILTSAAFITRAGIPPYLSVGEVHGLDTLESYAAALGRHARTVATRGDELHAFGTTLEMNPVTKRHDSAHLYPLRVWKLAHEHLLAEVRLKKQRAVQWAEHRKLRAATGAATGAATTKNRCN